MIRSIALVAIFAVAAAGPLVVAETVRDTSEFNLMNGVGLHGHDPVAIFPEGGGQARAGKMNISVDYLGVVYLFATEQNKQLFLQNPAKYEPTYGGYCAYAMAQGCKIDIDPAIFTIKGDRAHYFVSVRAKRNFDGDAARLEAQADANFAKMQGLGLPLGSCLPN